jgi:hypothetical protein
VEGDQGPGCLLAHLVVTSVFLSEMEVPVLVEITGCANSAELPPGSNGAGGQPRSDNIEVC